MKIRKFRNKYKGKKIFIVGTGPSLNKIPMKLLRNEYTFGIHRISLIYDRTSWRPTFFICITKRAEQNKKYRADILRTIDLGIPCFIGTRIKNVIPDASNIYWIKCKDIWDKEIYFPKEMFWYRDVGHGEVSIYGHTGFGAIQIARYMGFAPIYLIGMDLTYSALKNNKMDTNHFHPKYETGVLTNSEEQYKMYLENLRMAHELTAGKSAEEGLRIFSVDTNIKLDMYSQISLEEALK